MEIWNPINRFKPRHILVSVPRQDLDFQHRGILVFGEFSEGER